MSERRVIFHEGRAVGAVRIEGNIIVAEDEIGTPFGDDFETPLEAAREVLDRHFWGEPRPKWRKQSFDPAEVFG